MSNKESCAPVGLLDILKEIKTSRNKLDDLTNRMQTAMDTKRDEAVLQPAVDWLMHKDVKPDYAKQLADSLETGAKYFHSVFEAGREAGHAKGYDEGYKAGRDPEMQSSEQRDRELLEEHGIDVDGFLDKTVKMIEDRDDDDIDEDEPDQYPPNYGGTK